MVTLIDIASGQVVWLGEAIAEIQNNESDEVVRKRFHYIIKEIIVRIEQLKKTAKFELELVFSIKEATLKMGALYMAGFRFCLVCFKLE